MAHLEAITKERKKRDQRIKEKHHNGGIEENIPSAVMNNHTVEIIYCIFFLSRERGKIQPAEGKLYSGIYFSTDRGSPTEPF